MPAEHRIRRAESGQTPAGVVLVGGGHSHIEVLRRFGMRAAPETRLTLITRSGSTLYSGMLPGVIAGHFTSDEAHVNLATLTRFAGAQLVQDEAIGLDPVARVVRCRSGRVIHYDLLSIDIGSTPNVNVEGTAGCVIPVKPISDFIEEWNAVRDRLMTDRRARRIAVVGGGAGGVELMLAVEHRLSVHSPQRPAPIEYHLFTHALLPAHNPTTRAWLAGVLAQRGVIVHTGTRVEAVSDAGMRTTDGTLYEMDEVLWATEAAAAPWIAASGLPVDDRGFVRVDATLRSVSHPDVFAAGDIASVDGYALPKSGVVAVRQGPVLASNLRRALAGMPLRRYTPQDRYLSLISTGNRYAVASRGAWSVRGAWVWRVKEWIDRRFVERYNGSG